MQLKTCVSTFTCYQMKLRRAHFQLNFTIWSSDAMFQGSLLRTKQTLFVDKSQHEKNLFSKIVDLSIGFSWPLSFLIFVTNASWSIKTMTCSKNNSKANLFFCLSQCATVGKRLSAFSSSYSFRNEFMYTKSRNSFVSQTSWWDKQKRT